MRRPLGGPSGCAFAAREGRLARAAGFVVASAPSSSPPAASMSQQIEPGTAEELKEVVAWAVAEEAPLEILGAGSKRGYGRPVEAEARVTLARLAGIGLYEPAELVMSAKAGTPLAEIEARLADNHQQLAFEPPDYGPLLGGDPGRATIGGVFACNLSGPRRIKAGAARDHFLGVQAITGRGDLIKSGGRVVKNVTGYDLCKLFAGSFGTLAAMTEVTFKVLPAPEDACTLVVRSSDRASGFAALRTAMASAYEVAGAAYLPAATQRSATATLTGTAADLALVRLEGQTPSVRYRAERLKALLGTKGAIEELAAGDSAGLWREVRDVSLLPRDPPLWRVSVAPASGAALIGELDRSLDLDWVADWAGGLLWLSVRDAADGGAHALRTALAAAGGHATLIRGSAELRSAVAVFQPQEAALARLSARVKASFDPKRILNRRRMYPDV
jgi:glycolate oxidase FAD binding subunit